MKILCISDSHGYNEILESILAFHNTVDVIVHCGDSNLAPNNPIVKDMLLVKGNHDDESYEKERFLTLDSLSVYLSHGNQFDIYTNYDLVKKQIKRHNIDLFIHGHTHVPVHLVVNDSHIINPGSTMINRGSYGYGTYCIITSNKKDINVKFYHHTNHHDVTNEVLKDGITQMQQFYELNKNK